jgi:hypothetical protein
MQMLRKLGFVALAALMFGVALGGATGVDANKSGGSGGVTGPAFYVDGQFYRTVGTPTDLSGTGAPAHSFDVIYAIDGQPNVATVAPGYPGFNGGRWMVHLITFADYAAALAAYDTDGSGDFNSAAEVEAALKGGIGGALDQGVVKMFECPVIKVA